MSRPQEDTPDRAAKGAGKSLPRRILSLVVLLTLLLIVPGVAAFVLAGTTAATAGVIGSMIIFFIGVTSGTSRALAFLPVSVAALAASAVLGGSWWWALVIAGIGAAAGWAARYGLLVPMALVGVLFSVTPPTGQVDAALTALAFCAAGGLNGAALAHVTGAGRTVPVPPVPVWRARSAAIGLGLAAGAAGGLMLAWNTPHAYWLPMTVFVMAIPRPGVGLAQGAARRVLGTAVGVVGAGMLTYLDLPFGIPLILAAVFLLAGFLVKVPAWVSPAFTTAALVLVFTPPGGGLDVAGTRLEATLAGGAIIVTLAAIGAWLKGRWHPAGVDSEVQSSLDRLTGGPEPVVR